MYREYFISNGFGFHPALSGFFGAFFGLMLIPFIVWSIAWKGWALWKAAKNNSVPWFIALLLINTMGILEILYIFVFGKSSEKKKSK